MVNRDLQNVAWDKMKVILDKEMPQEKRKRLPFFWIFFGLALTSGGFYVLSSKEKVENKQPQISTFDESKVFATEDIKTLDKVQTFHEQKPEIQISKISKQTQLAANPSLTVVSEFTKQTTTKLTENLLPMLEKKIHSSFPINSEIETVSEKITNEHVNTIAVEHDVPEIIDNKSEIQTPITNREKISLTSLNLRDIASLPLNNKSIHLPLDVVKKSKDIHSFGIVSGLGFANASEQNQYYVGMDYNFEFAKKWSFGFDVGYIFDNGKYLYKSLNETISASEVNVVSGYKYDLLYGNFSRNQFSSGLKVEFELFKNFNLLAGVNGIFTKSLPLYEAFRLGQDVNAYSDRDLSLYGAAVEFDKSVSTDERFKKIEFSANTYSLILKSDIKRWELMPKFGMNYQFGDKLKLGLEYYREQNWAISAEPVKPNLDNWFLKCSYSIN